MTYLEWCQQLPPNAVVTYRHEPESAVTSTSPLSPQHWAQSQVNIRQQSFKPSTE